jgi:type II secretory pathway predicted ATPase ExeA
MSLYLDHFGLRESPYRITPHTEFFFSGANRGATLEALIYAVLHDEGIVKVTGEVGSGKTMLCRMLLEKLPDGVETIVFANPSLNREELLHALADELRLPLPPTGTHQLLRAIQQHLVEQHEAGRRVVVLIDEAHAMPESSLEEIRLLSNLETGQAKLLQIVLFGQPELNELLATAHMRQLRERITHNFFLEPLKQADVGAYLDFRLRAAGYKGPSPFSPEAIKRFGAVSHGLTRRLNILADKALLAAFAGNTHLVDQALAQVAIADAHFDDTGVARPDSAAIGHWRPVAAVLG